MHSSKQSLASSDKRPQDSIWPDITAGLFAGLVVTQVTNLAQKPLKRITPKSVDQHEKQVRPGASSSLVASQKIAEKLDLPTSDRDEELLGTAIHFAAGVCWGPVYTLLRRYEGLQPLNAALITGGSMSLILDEALVPALSLSAPNKHYPAFTRIRGFAAHLEYGAAVALIAERLERMMKPHR